MALLDQPMTAPSQAAKYCRPALPSGHELPVERRISRRPRSLPPSCVYKSRFHANGSPRAVQMR
jgi:hypothetical protein